MSRRINVILIALAALVTGTAVLVYAQHGEKGAPGPREALAAQAEGQGAADQPAQAEAAEERGAGESGKAPEVLYDLGALPDPVQRMLTEIIFAAESGEIGAMLPVLESNELKPMVAAAHVDDPIDFWKKESADGEGREILAIMLNVLSAGFVRVGKGHDEMYVWPYFAEIDLTKLTPAQEVEFYRTVPPQLAVPMKKSGKYGYYRLGISPSGVWHYFIK